MLRRWLLPVFITLFTLFSLVTLKSGTPELVTRQLLYFFVGGFIFFFSSRVSFAHWRLASPWLYIVLIFLLVLTKVVGQVTRGVTSWIPIGSFHIQPSQLAVAVVSLWACGWVSLHPLTSLRRLFHFSLVVFFPAVLIFIEPELGTTVVYLAALGSIFFLSRIRLEYIFGLIILVGCTVLFSWTFVLHPYQKERILTYINSTQNITGASYNAQQSVIAVGSGRVFGRGIGQGIQSQLRFLPERQTDFIFASFSEEMGMMGALPIILLYASLVAFLLFVAQTNQAEPERLFSFATATMIAVQASINIGMNIGLLPITGITLPFFSYGGSSILALCFQLGCLQAILYHQHKGVSLHIQ